MRQTARRVVESNAPIILHTFQPPMMQPLPCSFVPASTFSVSPILARATRSRKRVTLTLSPMSGVCFLFSGRFSLFSSLPWWRKVVLLSCMMGCP